MGNLSTPKSVQKLPMASHAKAKAWSLVREPDAGNLPVRFDEREQETELCQTGLRRALRKQPNSHREVKATAPVLVSTPVSVEKLAFRLKQLKFGG